MEVGTRKKKKNWNDLGVVDTIYEEEDCEGEEDDDYSTTSPSLSSPLSSAATALAETW